MRASDCLTASMIEVGMKYEKKIAFSHEDVETYCRLADDQNSIHRCLEAARVRFPDIDDIVVPGGLLQIAIAGLFGSYFPGDGSLGLTFEPDRVRKPIRPGDELLISLEVRAVHDAPPSQLSHKFFFVLQIQYLGQLLT